MEDNKKVKKGSLLPEWVEQDAVLLSWPCAGMDWEEMLPEIQSCYADIIKSLVKYIDVLLLAPSEREVLRVVGDLSLYPNKLVVIGDFPLNDTWVRDYGPLTLSSRQLVNFQFNAWGDKYSSSLDNTAILRLHERGLFDSSVFVCDATDVVFEGGGIEVNGAGVGLTTDTVLYDGHRNNSEEIVCAIKKYLGLDELVSLHLEHPLEGDDTDGHIDTLVRFIGTKRLLYVYDEENNMLKDLKKNLLCHFPEEKGYELLPLPMPPKIYNQEGRQLPATYANFLITNKAVLLPIYNVSTDEEAILLMQKYFPDRKIEPVNCLPLIHQNGSLHCATMQIPKGILRRS